MLYIKNILWIIILNLSDPTLPYIMPIVNASGSVSGYETADVFLFSPFPFGTSSYTYIIVRVM